MQPYRLILIAVLSVAPAVTRGAGASTPRASITVQSEDNKPTVIDIAALSKLPQHTVTAEAHGKKTTCDGVNLSDLVAKAGAPQGETLRGKALTIYVRVSASDGYRVVYSLAELDPAMHDDVPILTAHCDGAALDAKDGPFRIVYPGEKRPARWIRQVTSIDLLRAP
ncbi:MAG TPA: molybdopterin-dependent oxidoreductase [Rudaea sp.]|jgi:hypothetical protein|nr:molybdopterin-dependent oxidoreductase [Rudaea sp.]